MNETGAPAWLMEELRQARRGRGKGYIQETGDLLARLGLTTVCDSARCPNRGDCYSHHTATFLILGDVCTRGCTFCAVRYGRRKGRQTRRTRSTGGCRVFVEPEACGHYLGYAGRPVRWRRKPLRARGGDAAPTLPRRKNRTADSYFLGSRESLLTVLEAGPEILAHNVETVPRLYRTVRRGADYSRSRR